MQRRPKGAEVTPLVRSPTWGMYCAVIIYCRQLQKAPSLSSTNAWTPGLNIIRKKIFFSHPVANFKNNQQMLSIHVPSLQRETIYLTTVIENDFIVTWLGGKGLYLHTVAQETPHVVAAEQIFWRGGAEVAITDLFKSFRSQKVNPILCLL